VASPLAQFEIRTIAPLEIGGVDVSFTNSSLFMVIAIAAVTAFLVLGVRRRAVVPGRWQSMAELCYEFIASLVRDNVGHAGRPYFPFIFTLFMFILFCNSIGLIPYSFTVTSHIAVTFALAAVIFIGVTVLGIVLHGAKFLSYFMPPGVPLYMAPLLVPIEVVSYLARPVTLALRLFANMMAGHTMLKVFAGFVVALGIAGIFPLAVLIALYALEVIVALLQAYVFTILTCLYLHDALHLH
jgi:F-type H+-transporting ATPase subunit a